MIHIAFPGVGEVLAFIVYLRYLQRFLQIDLHDLIRFQHRKINGVGALDAFVGNININSQIIIV